MMDKLDASVSIASGALTAYNSETNKVYCNAKDS
jgi:hypothetical protein